MVTHDSFAASLLRPGGDPPGRGWCGRRWRRGDTDRAAFQDRLLLAIRDMGKE